MIASLSEAFNSFFNSQRCVFQLLINLSDLSFFWFSSTVDRKIIDLEIVVK